MLIEFDTNNGFTDPFAVLLANIMSKNAEQHAVSKGIYEISHFGSSAFLKDFEHYPQFENDGEHRETEIYKRLCEADDWFYRGSYGVCDSYEQILELYPELENSERQFVVTLTKVEREDQPEDFGWRWHKWGSYIGTQDPQHEYLYDDTHIDQVYCYHIYEKVNTCSEITHRYSRLY